MADRAIELGELRCTPSPAVFATLGASAPTEHQLARAICLINSGAKSVMVELWDLPARVRFPFVRSTYAALGTEGAAGSAMVGARKTLRDVDASEEPFGPSTWGGFVLIGLP
jgi:CHAT domain-containing protein